MSRFLYKCFRLLFLMFKFSRDLLVKMDHLELEDLVTRVPLELLDLLVHLALQVYQDHLVKVDLLETLEKGVKEVQMGHQD